MLAYIESSLKKVGPSSVAPEGHNLFCSTGMPLCGPLPHVKDFPMHNKHYFIC